VQTVYVHNEKVFGGNLSISFGFYGVSASFNVKGRNTTYYAKPILILD